MIMKMKRIYLVVLVLGALVTACELPDNVNPKAATEVPATTLFTNATVDFMNTYDAISMNINIGRFLAQYASQVNYTDESRYNFEDRSIPDTYWAWIYLPLRDYMEVRSLIGELSGSVEYNHNRDNKLATVDIMEVFALQSLIDYVGDIPYTEALQGADNKTPAYDDAETVYRDMMDRLRADISTLTTGAADGSWGDEDVLFGGDVAMWKKAAASLLLRMGMRFADVDASTAQAALADALSAGVFEDGDAWQLVWTGVTPHVNPIYDAFIVDNRFDYAPALTIMDKMEALFDPRMDDYFSQIDTSADGSGKFAYVGLEYGLPSAQPYNSISHFSDKMFAASFPSMLSDYVEVQFLLAEAAARGFTTPMTAQQHYEAAVTASIVAWGNDAADAAPYLALADVQYDQARWKELIGTQKWIALYNRPNEGYATWRVFDWPVLHPPTDMTQEDIPLRWPYPFNEKDLNNESYTAAAAAIGGDDVRTRLFWDATPNSATPSPN
jgi:hypothetical protein